MGVSLLSHPQSCEGYTIFVFILGIIEILEALIEASSVLVEFDEICSGVRSEGLVKLGHWRKFSHRGKSRHRRVCPVSNHWHSEVN